MTKNWVLIGKKLGPSHNIVEYYNPKTKIFITMSRNTNWITIRRGNNTIKTIDGFKTFSAKLKVAKQYMRTH